MTGDREILPAACNASKSQASFNPSVVTSPMGVLFPDPVEQP